MTKQNAKKAIEEENTNNNKNISSETIKLD